MTATGSVLIPFGERHIDLRLDPARVAADVIVPHDPPALSDPRAAFLAAAARPRGGLPLARLAADAVARNGRPVERVCIAISDHTRTVPDDRLVPWIVEALGVPDRSVTILIGTGTHRASTHEELVRKLGEAVLARFQVVNHDCQAEADLVRIGTSACGGECWINRRWVEADLRIVTGFIEPHFFAGFSGGSKGVVPGIAGLATIQHFHRAALIAHPHTTWGDPAGNPLQALSREMVRLMPPHAMVNVTLDRAKAITGLYVGEVGQAHDAGCADALRHARVQVARRYPVVVASNSGYPLDQNFYQAVKAVSVAARIVEPGGLMIIASECRAGLPAEGEFAAILADPRSSADLLAAILASTHTRHDQWQVQTLLQCLATARVALHSTLPPAQQALTRTEPVPDLQAFIDRMADTWHGEGRMPIAVLPLGPLTIPCLV